MLCLLGKRKARGMSPHRGDRTPSSLYRRVAGNVSRRLRTRQVDGIASGRNVTHSAASYHRFPRSEHLLTSKVDFEDSSYHTCRPSPQGKGTWDSSPHHHDSYVLLGGAHRPLAARIETGKEVEEHHRAGEALV